MSALIPNTRLSHGTIECEEPLTARAFYQRFLGLGSVRPLPEAQYLWSGGGWSLVCVSIGEPPRPNSHHNRFCLRVGTPGEVDAAYTAALAEQSTYGIREIREVTERDGVRSFMLHDRDGVWWEITNTHPRTFDEAFARGDVSAT